jgi:hypothetical protein
MLAEEFGSMAKHWMKAAFSNSHGQFKAKAQRAGMSTRAFAEREKDAGGLVGKQANLALVGMNVHHSAPKKTRSQKWYGEKDDGGA